VTPSAPPANETVIVSANSAWNIVNFRKPVIEALVASGRRVIAVAPPDGHEDAIRSLGAEFRPIAMEPGGTSPWSDARLLADYYRILRHVRPHAFLGFTVKPNIYGSIAARLLGVKAVNNISGLGTAFIRPGLLNGLVTGLYKVALRKAAVVFFQNRHDRDLFVGTRLVRPAQARLIPGSGVDLRHFKPEAEPSPAGPAFRFLFIGRLLRDKGVVEYAEAAQIVARRWPDAEFAMLGSAASNNPTAVPIAEIERWRREGHVTWLGGSDDVRQYLAQADCVVLPSYREGLPRSLLEAGAMAKPMIATDVPGCSDVVEHAVTGLLCEAKSAASLAASMEEMLSLPADNRLEMGRRARQKVEREFDESRVVHAYLDALS